MGHRGLVSPDRPMHLAARRLSLLLCALLLPGCGKLEALLGLDEDPPPPPPRPAAAAEADPSAEPVSAPPEPLVRASQKLRFPGKSGEHMGFDLDKLSKVYALAGAVERPEWSSPGEGSERLVRDDDLHTAWSCRPSSESGCALGIHFPVPAEVEAIRLYALPPGDGPARARPKRIRVHTTQGWAEARLADEDRLWHVLLGEPVQTRNLSVEIMETHGEGPVQLAELEVYGRTGTPRDPLAITLAHTVVAFDPPVWRKKLRTHSAGRAFLERVDADGRLQRLLPGTALVGRTGDRLLLIEQATWSTCDDHQGAYSLLDTHTRVLVPLGDMGGFGGRVFRHTEGLGFGIGRVEGDDAKVEAIVLDEGVYERRTTGRLDQRAPAQMLADWDIEGAPLATDPSGTLASPPPGCEPASATSLAGLRPHLPKRTSLDATQWTACSLGDDHQLLISTGGPCGKQWQVVVLGSEGALLGRRSGKEAGTHVRLRRLDESSMLIELWGADDRPRLLLAELGLVDVGTITGLSLRPPIACRTRCDTSFEDLGPGS
ncbi:hypothetical protein [Paraliomyxa miuraensis]|uniref:hypothetical protein n=1 Tax=Paraliomyxa miuraensis TaxID=376150 RepID=UPI0022559EA5|nr:hypothetical protein [Paraliomyxa miuraensis]MCX4241500.1 hypothetical protein [Paraliomyxa miuraensis]